MLISRDKRASSINLFL